MLVRFLPLVGKSGGARHPVDDPCARESVYQQGYTPTTWFYSTALGELGLGSELGSDSGALHPNITKTIVITSIRLATTIKGFHDGSQVSIAIP